MEQGRYHLYICLACPWANGAYHTLLMKGLQDVISVSIVKPEFGQVDADKKGWVFNKDDKSLIINQFCEDTLYGLDNMYQLY